MLKKMLNHSYVERGQNHNKSSNLWLGFTFGAIAATTIVFLLGTKKGRQTLKKLLEFSENLEENALVIAEQIEESMIEKAEKISDAKHNKPVLGSLLDK